MDVNRSRTIKGYRSQLKNKWPVGYCGREWRLSNRMRDPWLEIFRGTNGRLQASHERPWSETQPNCTRLARDRGVHTGFWVPWTVSASPCHRETNLRPKHR